MSRDTKVPPNSLDAEQAVLGAVLRNKEAFQKVRAVLEAKDFYSKDHHDAHRFIFAAMEELANRGEPIDLLTLQEQLKQGQHLEAAGGVTYLSTLIDATPTAGNVRHHAKIVKGKAVLRDARSDSLEIVGLIEGGEGSVDEIISRITALSNRATQAWLPETSDGLRPAWELAPETCRFLEDGIQGLTTGFPALDRKLMGLRGLVLLGAAPKVGKSTFCLNVALHVARDVEGASVLYYDVENGRNITMLRLLSNLYGLTIEQLRERRKFEGETWQADLEEKVPGLYLTTNHSEMRPEIIEHQIQKIGAEKTLVVLDSLQKLPPLAKQRRDSIDTWLRALEQIKQAPGVTILLVSELSRGEGGKHYQRPHLEAFKESGDAEYTADVALQFVGSGDSKNLICLANRHGESGYVASYSCRNFKWWRWTEIHT